MASKALAVQLDWLAKSHSEYAAEETVHFSKVAWFSKSLIGVRAGEVEPRETISKTFKPKNCRETTWQGFPIVYYQKFYKSVV